MIFTGPSRSGRRINLQEPAFGVMLMGDGDYQADEFAPNTERVKPGPFWVDKKGNIWMAYGFFRYDFQGLDSKGNPIYRADKITIMEPPEGCAENRTCLLSR